MSAVIYGKHPAFGDFIALGLEHAHFLKLDEWLNKTLPVVQSLLADEWEAVWRNAGALRFWIGPGVLGVPFFGLMAMSQDKVGRRYPLLFGMTGYALPSPTTDGHDESVYDAMWAHVSGFQLPKDGKLVSSALIADFVEPDLSAYPWGPGGDDVSIWGQRRDGDVHRLLTDARLAEAHKAQVSRSHWWRGSDVNSGRPAEWLATTGLPDAEAFYWLLTGRAAPASQRNSNTTSAGGV